MAENLMEASKESDIDLLKEMKRVKGSKSNGQTMHEEIDGELIGRSEQNHQYHSKASLWKDEARENVIACFMLLTPCLNNWLWSSDPF